MQPRKPSLALLALAALLSLAALAGPLGAARAQGVPTIGNLTIAIWPEFDQPAALVFYMGGVAPDTPLPATISFDLPPGASPHAVAYRNETGGLSNLAFETSGDVLTLTTPNGSFHVEFYDPTLALDGDTHSYSLTWQADEPVSALTWEVQQPAAATGMAIDPGGATLHRDDYGLPLYRVDAGRVEANTPATLSIEYTKPDPALTATLLEAAQPPAPGEDVPSAEDPRPAFSFSNNVFYGLALVIVAALAAVAGYFYSQARVGGAAPAAGPDPRLLTPLPHPPPAAPRAAPAQAAPPRAAPPPPPAPDPAELAAADGLTEREIEVLTLVAEDMMNDEIGEKLGISHRTVGRHRENIMSKLDLHSRAELVKYAIRIGLIDLED